MGRNGKAKQMRLDDMRRAAREEAEKEAEQLRNTLQRERDEAAAAAEAQLQLQRIRAEAAAAVQAEHEAQRRQVAAEAATADAQTAAVRDL